MPGAFDVQIHYNGTLFAQGTEIEAMQRGNLEVGMISPQDIAALIPEYSIFTTGYLMRDAAHLDAVYDGDIGAEYKARVAKELGLQIMRSQYLGTRQVILREPNEVMAPADLAGLKLRMPGSEAWQFLGNALGANATPLAFEEIYLALQTGTIDGLENPLPDVISAKFYEVVEADRADRPHGLEHLLHHRQAVLGRPDRRGEGGDRAGGGGGQGAQRRGRPRRRSGSGRRSSRARA